MPIGEFTKYGLVFGSSLIGAVSGYFYSSRAVNLRMRLERNGTRVLRSSDPLWMYERMVRRNKEEIKKLVLEDKTIRESTESSASSSTTATPELTESELALKLLNWCDERLTHPKWKSDREVQAQVVKNCAFPDWMK